MTGPSKPDGAGKVFAPSPVRKSVAQGGRPPGEHVSSHGGREIEPRVRAPFEARLAHDFSSVRVHSGEQAADVASGLQAQAVTVGTDVYFGSGRYAPHAEDGAELLGHELAHVAQQARGGASPDAEARADHAASEMAKGASVPAEALGGAPVAMQAKPEPNAGAPSGPTPRAPAGENFASTLDRFDFDSDTLIADHMKAIDSLAYSVATRIKLLAAGTATIAITGHTDTAGSKSYNKSLGQRRADKVMGLLRDALRKQGLADAHLTAFAAASAGEAIPAVPGKDNVREPRNRRVEIQVTITSPASTAAAARTPMGGLYLPPGPLTPTPDPLPAPRVPIVPTPSHERVKDHFEHDPLLKELPKFARDQLVTALKDGDELAATAIIGSLNLGDKAAPVTAAVRALLQLIKGRTYKPPLTPPVQPDFGPPRTQQKMPGEKIFTLPPINLPKPFD